MFELLEHTFEETWLMLPLLYLSYLVIDYFERKQTYPDRLFDLLQSYGPLIGAMVGLLPQCGFGIIASILFIQRNISLGTLVSVFIATSDEAIPILIAHPDLYQDLILIILIKFIVAVMTGYSVDKLFYPKQTLAAFEEVEDEENENSEESGTACPCCYVDYPLPISALLRTLKIFGFIFMVTFIFNFFLHMDGETVLGKLLLSHTFFQPVLAALIGFIPNCVSSVVLTQLYVIHQLSFASLVAGLITNAGMGIVMLVRYQASRKDLFTVLMILLLSALMTSLILILIPGSLGL